MSSFQFHKDNLRHLSWFPDYFINKRILSAAQRLRIAKGCTLSTPGLDYTRLFISLTAGAGTRSEGLSFTFNHMLFPQVKEMSWACDGWLSAKQGLKPSWATLFVVLKLRVRRMMMNRHTKRQTCRFQAHSLCSVWRWMRTIIAHGCLRIDVNNYGIKNRCMVECLLTKRRLYNDHEALRMRENKGLER